METRKDKERQLHNTLRNNDLKSTMTEFERLTSNKKWYTVTRKSRTLVKNYLFNMASGERVLDYCCGNGNASIDIGRMGANEVIGVDVSNISVENARKSAEIEGVDNVRFEVMDAEAMTFEDNYFGLIYESGVLHHLDLNKSYLELMRVLKPDGKIICTEALRHNPLFHYYRKRTSHLRTQWEVDHILGREDIELAKKHFNNVEIMGFFHFATLAAVPFRNMCGFNLVLSVLENLDSIFLKLPVLKWQAWQVVFVLSNPKK